VSCEDVDVQEEFTVSPPWPAARIQAHYATLLRQHGPGPRAIQAEPTVQRMCFERIAAALEPMPPGRLLDVGCGVGDLIPFLPHGWSYVGLDFTPDLLVAARRRYPWCRFVLADATMPPLAPESVDVAVLCKVFSYQPIAVALAAVGTAWRCVRRALVWLDNQYHPSDSSVIVRGLQPASIAVELAGTERYFMHVRYVASK
jgi:SAM-dependent methyltransferase